METTTMADKNLHDIKIDELDSPKKTPLKNILTLLALLFIILVISVVITRLILGTDGSKEIEENATPAGLATELQRDGNESLSDGTKTALIAAAAGVGGTAALIASNANRADNVPVLSHSLEKNNSSRTKTPLRTHEPVKEVKRVVTKAPRTYKTPKHTSHNVPKLTRHTTPKKTYADRVVAKKTSTSHAISSRYLGGKEKKLTRNYYIQVGSYKNTNTILSKVKKQNFNYALQKVSNHSDITRVFVGPFSSASQAAKNLSKIKAHILKGAYVKKVIP